MPKGEAVIDSKSTYNHHQNPGAHKRSIDHVASWMLWGCRVTRRGGQIDSSSGALFPSRLLGSRTRHWIRADVARALGSRGAQPGAGQMTLGFCLSSG